MKKHLDFSDKVSLNGKYLDVGAELSHEGPPLPDVLPCNAATATSAASLEALTLLRLRRRTSGPGPAAEMAAAFWADHDALLCDHARQAVRRACLALECAFVDPSLWPQWTALAPREARDALVRQLARLRRLFCTAGDFETDGDATSVITDGLSDFRQRALDAMDASISMAWPSAVEADEQLLAALAEALHVSGFSALADLVDLRSPYGESLLLVLADYFLVRALEADAELGGPFLFIHVEQPDDPWPKDLAALIRLVEERGEVIAARLDEGRHGTASAAPSSTEDDALAKIFEDGLNAYLRADYQVALERFTAALRLEPDNCPLYAYRGDTHRLLCDYDRAVADYSAALKLNPASAPVLAQRAATFRLQGNLEQALADNTAALRIDPGYVPALLSRAEVHADQGNLDKAIDDTTAAIHAQPRNPVAHFVRGQAHQRLGAQPAAVADFSQVLEGNPHHVMARLLRGDAHRTLRAYADAIGDYTEVLRQHPRNAPAYRGRAQARLALGDSAGALADFNMALRVDPADVEAYRCRGALYRRQGDLDRALPDLDEAIRRADRDAFALHQRGLLFLARGLLTQALADFDDALAIDVHTLPAYLGRALVLDRFGRFAEGIQSCGRALQLDSRSTAALVIRGMIASHAGHHAQAIVDFTQALALDAACPCVYLERALACRLTGNLAQAMADLTHLTTLEPANAVALANRGVIHQLQGAHDLAVADFAEALKLDPQCIVAGWHQGLADPARERTTKTLAAYLDGVRLRSTRAAAAPPTRRRRTRAALRPPGVETSEFKLPPKTEGDTPDVEVRPIMETPTEEGEILGSTPDEAVSSIREDAPPVVEQAPQPAVADDTAADLLLTLEETPALDDKTVVEEPSPAPGALTLQLPPVRCPMCRATAIPTERLDGGRLRCGNCEAAFMPTAGSSPSLPTAPVPPAHRDVAKPSKPSKSQRKAPSVDEDDESRYTNRQKLLMAAAAAAILFVAYSFLPSFGGSGGAGPPVANSVSAEEFLKDFSTNAANAAKKYSHGFVVVTGEVSEVFADKRPRVRFKVGERSKGFIEAVFAHVNDLKDIKKSDRITVRGECEGWQRNILEITLCKVVADPTPQQVATR